VLPEPHSGWNISVHLGPASIYSSKVCQSSRYVRFGLDQAGLQSASGILRYTTALWAEIRKCLLVHTASVYQLPATLCRESLAS
jgi:hypothetical protein